MTYFFSLDIATQAAVISAIVAVIALLFQLFKKNDNKKNVKQSVKGNQNKVAQIEGDNAKIQIK